MYVVFDFAGYKVESNGRDKHHSISLPEYIVPNVIPELRLDPQAIRPASLILGVATQGALGVEKVQVVSEDYPARVAA